MTVDESSKLVLLVDDDREIVRGAALRLQLAGFKTIEAFDGIQGLQEIHKCRPDVIVLDQRMPRMNGITLLKTIKDDSELKHIPVIMLTADLTCLNEALDAGARFFMKKPYQGPKLVAAVKQVFQEAEPEVSKSETAS